MEPQGGQNAEASSPRGLGPVLPAVQLESESDAAAQPATSDKHFQDLLDSALSSLRSELVAGHECALKQALRNTDQDLARLSEENKALRARFSDEAGVAASSGKPGEEPLLPHPQHSESGKGPCLQRPASPCEARKAVATGEQAEPLINIVPPMPPSSAPPMLHPQRLTRGEAAACQELSIPGMTNESPRRGSCASAASMVVSETPNFNLEAGQPAHIQPLPVWLAGPPITGRNTRKTGATFVSRTVANANITGFVEAEAMLERELDTYEHGRVTEGMMKWCIVHPSSYKRACWDVASLLLVIYDMIVIPFQLFEPDEVPLMTVMSWTTRLFWTCDIPNSFLSGYMTDDGFIEMRPRMIARHYMRTWCILDTLIVGSDWLDLVWGISSGMDYVRMGKASRTVRILRMLRLLRLLKSMQIVGGFVERFQSEKLSIITDIGKIMVFIVGWSHVTACIWYGIGAQDDNPRSWLNQYNLQDRSLAYKYLTSLHWALSQFTGGMDEVTAENYKERIYVIAMLLGAFVMAASFTSNLTSSMTRLHILTSGQSQQLSTLRRYLTQNGISNRLALRIQRNAQLGVSSKYISESSVELLSLVSLPLQIELHFEMHLPSFVLHPFFAKYNQECAHVMREICHSAASMLRAGCGDVIFNAGEMPSEPKMYMIRSGCLEYIHVSGKVTAVIEDDWVCEAALWVEWMHRGVLKATCECQLLQVDARTFQNIVSRFEHPTFDPRAYAAKFVAALNEREEALDVMDINLQEIIDKITVGGGHAGHRARTMVAVTPSGPT